MLKDIEPIALTYIMEFIYCGIVEVPKKRLEDVLHVAKQLQIKGLYNVSTCERNKTSLPSSIRIEDEDESRSHHSIHSIGSRRDVVSTEPNETNYKTTKSSNSLLNGSICGVNLMEQHNKRPGASYQGSIDTDNPDFSRPMNVNVGQFSTGNSSLVSHWKFISQANCVLITYTDNEVNNLTSLL